MKNASPPCVLIKLGGSVLEEPQLIQPLCRDLLEIQKAGISVALVHGGGKAINQALEKHHITSEFYQGLRVTTDAMMDIIEMVLCGQVNSGLVRALNQGGVSAVGFSGCDQKMLQCGLYSAVHGRVGQVQSLNIKLIEYCLSNEIVPVIAPIGVDDQGSALNINADWVASHLALALNVRRLIYITDQDGIYNAHHQIISELYTSEIEELIAEQTITAGMLTKVNAILHAVQNGIDAIHIVNGKNPRALSATLFGKMKIGTVIKQEDPCYVH